MRKWVGYAFLGVVVLAVASFGWSRVSEEGQRGGSGNSAADAALAAEFSSTYTQVTDDYRQRMASIQQTGRDALNDGDQDGVLAVYAALRDTSVAAAERFREAESPPELRDDHERLVQNLDAQGAALTKVLTAAENRDEPGLSDGLTQLASLLVDYASINQALDQELAQGP